MYQVLLNAVEGRMTSIGMSLQLPATNDELKDLRFKVQRELESSLPEEYCEFLARTNGLDWNGLVVYATQRSPIVGRTDVVIEGFVEGNLNYRGFEQMKEYLIFADDGTVLYVYNVVVRKYQVILRVGLSVLGTFDSFSELLFDALKASWPFPMPETKSLME
jgi:hypothetical protein